MLFRSVTVFIGVQLCNENFRNQLKPLTVLTESPGVCPMLNNMHVLSVRSSRDYENMGCSKEGELPLILLAE